MYTFGNKGSLHPWLCWIWWKWLHSFVQIPLGPLLGLFHWCLVFSPVSLFKKSITLRDSLSTPPPIHPNNPTTANVHPHAHKILNQVDWIIDAHPSDVFVQLHKSDRDWQNVWLYWSLYMSYSVCLPKSYPQPFTFITRPAKNKSKTKTCTVPSDIHHKCHKLPFILFFVFVSLVSFS